MNRRTFLGNLLTLAGAAIIKPPPIIFDMGANIVRTPRATYPEDYIRYLESGIYVYTLPVASQFVLYDF